LAAHLSSKVWTRILRFLPHFPDSHAAAEALNDTVNTVVKVIKQKKLVDGRKISGLANYASRSAVRSAISRADRWAEEQAEDVYMELPTH
jgi:hypothetical protein